MNHTRDISVEVKLTSKDLVQFNFGYLFRKSAMAILLTVTFIILVSWISIISNQGYFSVPGVVWFWLLFMILIPIVTYRSAKKSYNNKFIQETKSYEFSEEGIRLASESMSALIKWNDLRQVITTKNAMYFFITDRSAQILPLRCVTEAQKNSLLSLIKEKVVHKKKRFGVLVLIMIFIYLMIFLVTVGVFQYISAD
ncbi:hypothetical protein Back11_37920 [Paenibacillus baekrokdamisoli]|uniref:Uncharacterized protein n=1 Tax=Paenibacillus baekrokdamisoli TaxID=1712516 RepID=A0A3G9IU92_9BACL|nr:YcxB family protein [Paenibacillus baekrokdamisoli]MBB3068514.1 energy-coupling factor transporter transmembrane protein EcfT [Paenibacillus baekrokdamisoli]BBH22447.1 hypothetical protein Back11_37920 [Paenibacillus baekrokdamisoli]